jgi:chemotaxis protein histidine kinase CheA
MRPLRAFLLLICFLQGLPAALAQGSASPSCGFLGRKIDFSDGGGICVRDIPLFRHSGLISTDPNATYASRISGAKSYAVAVTANPQTCPLAMFIAWDWSGHDEAEALPRCNERLAEAVRRRGSASGADCKCEVLVDSGRTTLTAKAFLDRSALLEQQWSAGGAPIAPTALAQAVPSAPVSAAATGNNSAKVDDRARLTEAQRQAETARAAEAERQRLAEQRLREEETRKLEQARLARAEQERQVQEKARQDELSKARELVLAQQEAERQRLAQRARQEQEARKAQEDELARQQAQRQELERLARLEDDRKAQEAARLLTEQRQAAEREAQRLAAAQREQQERAAQLEVERRVEAERRRLEEERQRVEAARRQDQARMAQIEQERSAEQSRLARELVELRRMLEERSRAEEMRRASISMPSQYTERVALVVGNRAYQVSPLVNPINDARVMRDRLQAVGFRVIYFEDLRVAQIGDLLEQLHASLKPGAAFVFFYAGHGTQIDGENFFPAVDARMTSSFQMPTQSLELARVIKVAESRKTAVNLLILDACRDNPWQVASRTAARGLSKIEPASGTLVFYATRPGSVAADASQGNHGLFTYHLLQHLNTPMTPVEQVFKRVSADVLRDSAGKQIPWIEGQLVGDFAFVDK